MSKDNQIGDEKNSTENFLKGLDERIDVKFDSLERKMDSIRRNKKESEEDYSWLIDEKVNEDDVEEKKIDISSVENLIEKKAAKIAKTIVNQTLETATLQARKDNEIIEKIPEMNPKSDRFDKKFADEVRNEMQARLDAGRSNDPTLLYDSATSVHLKWINEGRIIPEHIVKEERRRLANEQASLSFNGGQTRTVSSKEISQQDLQLASQFRLSPERFKQLNDKYGFYK